MNKALDELKTQAKLLLKSAKNNQPTSLKRLAKYANALNPASTEQNIKLKHCQYVIAKELGFADWQHLHSVFSATKHNPADSLDFGSCWHNHTCNALINLWFNTYQEALEVFNNTPNSYLLPYKKQFVLVNSDYIQAIGLDNLAISLWQNIKYNLVVSYPSDDWDDIAKTLLRFKA